MKNRFLTVMLIISILVLAGLTACTETDSTSSYTNQQEGIWVNGRGQVYAAPDLALLKLGVSVRQESVAKAQSEAALAMDKVMSALKAGGIADADIQTQYFNIQQETRWDEKQQQEIVTGFRVTNTVTAKIRDTGKVGKIIDSAASAGGDLTRVEGISFTFDDTTEYRKEARTKAMTDARDKAEQLAKLSGVKLGKPVYISESVSYPVYAQTGRPADVAAAPATPISPGEMSISIDVQVVYTISK